MCTFEGRKSHVRPRYWTRVISALYSHFLCVSSFKGQPRSSRFDTNQTVMATWKFRSIITRRELQTGAALQVFCRSEQRNPGEPPMRYPFFLSIFIRHVYGARQFFSPKPFLFRAYKRETMIETPSRSSKRSSSCPSRHEYFHRFYISRRYFVPRVRSVWISLRF